MNSISSVIARDCTDFSLDVNATLMNSEPNCLLAARWTQFLIFFRKVHWNPFPISSMRVHV